MFRIPNKNWIIMILFYETLAKLERSQPWCSLKYMGKDVMFLALSLSFVSDKITLNIFAFGGCC